MYITQYNCFVGGCFFLAINLFTLIYFTLFRKQEKADINSLQWLEQVGLEPAYTRM